MSAAGNRDGVLKEGLGIAHTHTACEIAVHLLKHSHTQTDFLSPLAQPLVRPHFLTHNVH
jgi:hypothetical protein